MMYNTTHERGSLFTRSNKPGYVYELVRTAADARGTTANGTPTAPKYLWNLVNLTNDGKARVSDQTRQLETDGNYVTLAQLVRHFDLDLIPAGHIRDHKDVIVKSVVDKNAAKQQDQFANAMANLARLFADTPAPVMQMFRF